MKFSEPPWLWNESDDDSSNLRKLFSMWFQSVKKGALNLFKGGGDIKSELHDLDKMPNYVEIVRIKCQKN